MQSHLKDLISVTLAKFARAATAAITAAGAGDNTQLDGSTLDIEALATRPSSVMFLIPVTATLAEGETCTVTGLIQKSADGTNWDTLRASATLLTLTGGSGGSTETGVARVGADVVESDCRYVRFRATPDLSASGTDTMQVGAAVAVFGGLMET